MQVCIAKLPTHFKTATMSLHSELMTTQPTKRTLWPILLQANELNGTEQKRTSEYDCLFSQ